MPTKSNLEKAVEEKAKSLNDAQREIVLSQFSVYKQNRTRIRQIHDRLMAIDAQPPATFEETRFRQSQRAALAYESNQLATANNEIADKLFAQLSDEE